MLKKIAVTGPESTGKSLLARKLAEHYHTVWVPEVAREYIDRLNRPYREEDIVKIARAQLRTEKEIESKACGYLFCDTELLVTRIWSEVKYGHCDPWILNRMETHRYDLFLLCAVDLPWEPDPQREHPHLREYLFDLYHREMVARGWRFGVVTGQGEQRVWNAIKFVEGCL